MFSHHMKKRGQQHYWLPPLGHVTRVMWPRRTWLVGLAADRCRCGHLNRAGPRGPWPLIWSQRERGGDCQPHQTPATSHSQGDTKSEEPEIQYGGQTEVTHTDGRTPPHACFSACTLCTEVQLTSQGPVHICSPLFPLQCHRVALQHVFCTSIALYKKQPWQGHLPVADRTGAKRAMISRTRSSVADLLKTSTAQSD